MILRWLAHFAWFFFSSGLTDCERSNRHKGKK